MAKPLVLDALTQLCTQVALSDPSVQMTQSSDFFREFEGGYSERGKTSGEKYSVRGIDSIVS